MCSRRSYVQSKCCLPSCVSLSGTVQYNYYIYYVEISLSTSTQLTHEFTSLEFTTYNAAFIDLEADLINIQICTKAHNAQRCTFMLIRLSRSYLSYETDAFKMICLPLVNLSTNFTVALWISLHF